MSNVPKNAVRKANIGNSIANNLPSTSGNDHLPGWIGWVAGLLVAAIVLSAAVLSAGSWGLDTRVSSASEAMAPAVGGMVFTRSQDYASASSTVTSPADLTEAAYVPGTQVVSRQSETPIYADAGADALLLHTYASGSAFTVLEPSGDYAIYPVPDGEVEWIRVRAADGLVGWIPVDAVVVYP